MAVSNARTAKRNLHTAIKARLQADQDYAQVGVWHGAPNHEHNFHDNVTIGAADISQEWATLGATRRQEDIAFTVLIESFRGGTDEFAAEDRVWDIADEVMAAITADLDLDDTVAWSRPDRLSLSTEAFQDGRMARVEMTVFCRSRLT